LKILVFINYC